MKKAVIIGAVIIICVAPYLFTREWGLIAFGEAEGVIGDTIGGITAPIVGVLSILLLYYTLAQQRNFNIEQQKTAKDEQFKTTLFNLVQTQREILREVRGSFSYLGHSVDDECPAKKAEIIKVLCDNREWGEIQKWGENKSCGLEFFRQAKYQLKLIYEALDCEKYYNNYDSEFAANAESNIVDYYAEGTFPQEKLNEITKREQSPYRAAYINDKYTIKEALYDLYHKSSEAKKIRIGYALFFRKHEEVGYYFRHLYHILKFIKLAEDEAISGKKENIKQEEVRNHFRQYAQFVQAQMSVEELVLFFYNSFMFCKSQELIIHYDLLENLTIQNLIDKKHNCDARIKMKDRKEWFLEIKNER